MATNHRARAFNNGGGAKKRLMAEMAELEKEKWVKIDVSPMMTRSLPYPDDV
jgi:hypothetical protein